ncbi:MAG: RNA polymerase sigma factor [Chloroflexi bacterium]|nr:RNA polymerase sigma factor [Ardenticatenaceae bacterium]MBL1128485.1 RNA polymerase sigma factor [Chloroflexota bacterium]NOG34562.1 RNA polymerase sigma factor [Chloroflexota bacterium]GIK56804.1 MAG: RNA polymerase subunit sigma-24 [Chloroflexota bacterium]
MTLSGKIGGEESDRAAADERPWLRQARQGDEAAWEWLVAVYQQPVFRLAYLLLGDAAEAEEVAQDVFVRAYFALDRFDESRPLRPWLLQITRNLARNKRRSLGRYWAAVQRWWLHQPEAVETAEKQPESQLLWQAVRQLRPSAQEIIYLRYFLEMNEAETAVALGIQPGTVKSRLHRALKQLQVVVERDFPELSEHRP